MMRTAPAMVLVMCLLPGSVRSSGFEVNLVIDYTSAERTLELYQGLAGSPATIAFLRGSRIALATTGLLAQCRLTLADLEQSLQAAKFGQHLGDDHFRMLEARGNASAIQELLSEMKRRNFARRVAATVEHYFPPNSGVQTSIPVFVVAFGHQNIDAFVRRVVWEGDTPRFVGEGEGELTIVVNLAKAVHYGRTLEERYIGTLGLVAHEVFHAAFGVYKDASTGWQDYYARGSSHLDRLLDLTHNEGIAHYITFIQRTRANLPPGWDGKVRDAIGSFNRNAELLLSPRISPRDAFEIIQRSNTSGYWESYGAITGLFIAMQIDEQLGRPALTESIASGVDDFFLKYVSLARRNSSLPPLSDVIVDHLRRRN